MYEFLKGSPKNIFPLNYNDFIASRIQKIFGYRLKYQLSFDATLVSCLPGYNDIIINPRNSLLTIRYKFVQFMKPNDDVYVTPW